MDKKKRERLIKLILSWNVPRPWILFTAGALAALVYLNILGNSFIFDDWQQIVDNPFLRRSDGLHKIFTTGVWQFLGQVGVSNFYRPLMHAAFYAVFQVSALNPAGYHAVSILLHAAVTLLVFLVVVRISRDKLGAALAAMLFAVHPVHVESVAWISAYPELLCALFSLLAFWVYLSAEEVRSAPARLALRLSVGPLVLLGLLAKEIAIVTPVLLALYELTAGRASGAVVYPGKGGRRPALGDVAARVWPAYASAAVAIAVYLAARIHALGALMPARAVKPLPAAAHLWTAVAVFWRYIALLFAPVHLHAFYYLPASTSVASAVVIAGLASAAAVLALGLWLWRKRRPESLAVPLYLIALAPALTLPYASIGLLMAERYVYLASVGFCWLLGMALAAAIRHWGFRVAGSVALALVVLGGARTVVANTHWADEIRFYQDTIADFPGFPRAYLNLGEAYMRRNRWEEARLVTQQAVALDRTYAEPHVNLGLIERRLGDHESAIREFSTAAQLAEAHENRFIASRALSDLAVTYRGMNRVDDSIAASRAALAIDPEFAGGENNLGYALITTGKLDEAIGHLQRAVALDPALDVAWSNLGLAYSLKRQWDNSASSLNRALHLNPYNAETHARMAEVRLATGQVKDAINHLRIALMLDPNNERARAKTPPPEAGGPGERR